jgi:Flp pilus assembly protein TadG
VRRRIREKLFSAVREDGQVLALFAFGLVVFCGLVGMAVDVGQLVYTRTDLQKIADAAALAGAQDLPTSTSAARTSAATFGSANGSSTLDVTFSSTAVANDTITVTATRHVTYSFLKVIGLSGTDVSATAKAKGANAKPITGYAWTNIAPFIIWGGGRQSEVHPGIDNHCDLHVCPNSSYTFMDVGWMNKQGKPTAPDWTADSNNFKGDIDHGAGAPVSEIGETFSDGGLGSVTAPAPGTIIVVPIVNKAAGGSNLRTFTIAAWAVIRVDAGCSKTHCTGTVLDPLTMGTAPPPGYDTTGSTPPPPSLGYKAPASTGLIQ